MIYRGHDIKINNDNSHVITKNGIIIDEYDGKDTDTRADAEELAMEVIDVIRLEKTK